jgi:uncharacterized protein (DUF2384 family)
VIPRIYRLDRLAQAIVVLDGAEEGARRRIGRPVLGIDEQRPVDLGVQRSLPSTPPERP